MRATAGIDPYRISVSASGGYVRLSGGVDTEGERTLAQEIVEKMLGVTGVLNEVIVVPRSRSARPLLIG